MTARWKLRVHAEGAQGIKAATGLVVIDKKPDPYVTFVFGGVTKQCEPIDNVEPDKFFSWPQAVAEYDVAEEAAFLQSSLTIHVKDSDIGSDRYIGGTSIPLAPLYAAKTGETLCQSKFFGLEYADEKFTKKKNSGEVKITITVVDTLKKSENIGVLKQSEKEEIPPLKKETSSRRNETEMKSQDNLQTAVQTPRLSAEKTGSDVQTHAADDPTTQINQSPPAGDQPVLSEQKIVLERAVEPLAEKQRSKRDLAAQPSAKFQPESPLVVEQKTQELTPPVELKEPQNVAPHTKASVVKSMKIELVSARNLTRPLSIGNFIDRKPDPSVTLEFCGISKSSAALKDVDLKKPVEWSGVFLEFDLPQAISSSKFRKGCGPMTLVAHVKDIDLTKATYMGGGTLDLSSIFQPQSQDNGQLWIASAIAQEPSPIERVVHLTHSDEKLSKKKACGELTLRFHFICEELVEVETRTKEESDVENTNPALTSDTNSTRPADGVPVAEETQKSDLLSNKQESRLPISSPTEEPTVPVKEVVQDIKMLSIELLCGRDLLKPTVKSLAKSVMKSLFDRKPDPYAVLVLGAQTRKCAALNNVDVAFFEWKNAIQIFEFASKPYPDQLLIHIRDDDIAGSDPYMGGVRVAMQDIWDEASRRASSLPPGDPQVVKTYQLNFVDEKMTMQKQCGSVTVRFRWVYSDTPLPVEVVTAAPSPSEPVLPPAQGEDTPRPDVPVPAMSGFVFFRNMTMFNNKEVLDPSLDLYIEVSPFSPDSSNHQNHSAPVAQSSVLADATKGMEDARSKLEWVGDELVIPICVPLDGEHSDIHIMLKDKNAIMKDTEVAAKAVRIKDLGVDISDGQFATITVELVASSKGKHRSAPTATVKFQADVRFLAHSSPLVPVADAEKAGGVFTLFLVRSVLKPSPLAKDSTLQSSAFAVAIDCQATKKAKGLLSFGKSDAVEFRTSSIPVVDSKIHWWSAAEFPLSGKQVMAMKEKEALEFEFQVRMTAGKSEKQIGSVLLNAFPQAFAATSSTHTQTIELGALGSMELEFAAGFRGLVETKHREASDSKDMKHIAPAVPSGDLHIIILSAKNLIPPDAKNEKAEDLDPEVRISIEPKYIKRKDNPVRAMLKTKPLENAGAVPTWNEYLRVEYRLPPPAPPPPAPRRSSLQAVVDPTASEAAPEYPPPVVHLGVFDIQMPGEKNGSQPVGKVELPLSAFLLPIPAQAGASAADAESVSLSVDVYLAGKKTGLLLVEGVFEPLQAEPKPSAEDALEVYRLRCRAAGRKLRERAKKLKSGELTATASDILSGSRQRSGVAGRLELHIVGFRSSSASSSVTSGDAGLVVHLWLSSSIEDRYEFKSKLATGGSDECQLEWDARLTLHTSDIKAELLRSEILTLTGKPVGSLKLPLLGLLANGRGSHPVENWYTIIDPGTTSTKASTKEKPPLQEILIELSFFADQSIFDPLTVDAEGVSSADVDSSATVVVDCQRVLYIDTADASEIEVAVKCSLTGATTVATGKAQAASGVERTGFKACDQPVQIKGDVVRSTRWDEQLTLDIGSSARAYVHQSFAQGTHPAVRLDLLTKRPGARFPATQASTSLSLVTVVQSMGKKITRWLKFFDESDPKKTQLVALMQVEITIMATSITREAKQIPQSLEDATPIKTTAGVLCLRFLSARNLVDVDANGDQDPYIVARVAPRSSSRQEQYQCQTGVSLNGGRHPKWNSTIFELRVEDLHSDYLRIEVLDSNEEDHLPDAYIGAIDIALASLFRDCVVKKTRWLEAWVPIYPVLAKAAQDDGDRVENAGEVRVEFRFLSQAYYDSASRQEDEVAAAAPSPFTAVNIDDNNEGTLYFHVVQALDLPCSKGMQPGIRIGRDNVAQVSKPGKESIENPSWENEVMALPWKSDAPGSTQLQVEIVDLSVRTANVNALAVIAFGRIDIRTFLAYPRAKSYHLHRLQGRKAPSDLQSGPRVLLGCQFIPGNGEKETTSLLEDADKRGQKERRGNLHLKALEIHFNMAAFLSRVPLACAYSVRFSLVSKDPQTKSITLPVLSLAELIDASGRVPLDPSTASLLFKYEGDDPSQSLQATPNPILLGHLVSTAPDEKIVAEIEVPVFDFVLVDGHLSAGSYALMAMGDSEETAVKIGDISLEVQFLPTLSPAATAAVQQMTIQNDAAAKDAIVMYDLEVKRVTGLVGRAKAATAFVVVAEWLGCQAETRPSISSGSTADLEWNECLGLAVASSALKDPAQASNVLKLELRSAADANLVLGTCRWMAPVGAEAVTDAVVPLEPPASTDASKTVSKSKPQALLPEIIFRFSKRTANAEAGGSRTSTLPRLQRRRHALLYIIPVGSSASTPLRAAVLPVSASKSLDDLKAVKADEWMELCATDRRVLALEEPWLLKTSEYCVAIVQGISLSDCVSVACIDPQTLASIIKVNGVETFHRLPVSALGKPASGASLQSIECKIMAMSVVEGALELQLENVTVVNASGPVDIPAAAKFFLEMRLLGSPGSQQWISSPLGTWNRKTTEIGWRNGSQDMTLCYSNVGETSEPVLQLVLQQVVGKDQQKKVAFGQIAVLSLITRRDAASFQPVTAELTKIDGPDTMNLHFQLRFVRDAMTVEERAALDSTAREAKSLQLAEGTASLKKAFAAMGGDEKMPVTIDQLKQYVTKGDRATEMESVRQVLQSAADLETDGDLDDLFAMMDVNGDGQISWDEYVDHMQNVHALADAEASRSLDRAEKSATASSDRKASVVATQQVAASVEPDPTDGGLEEDDDEEEDDLSDEEPEETIAIPTTQLVRRTTEVPVQDVYKTPTVPLPSGQATAESTRPPTQAAAIEERRRTIARPAKEERQSLKPQSLASEPVYERRPPVKSDQPAKKPRAVSTLSAYVLDWKVDDVVQWMTEEMELGQYAAAILTNAVNGKLLLTLHEDELESELGVVAVLHKRKLMNQINEFQARFQYPPPEEKKTVSTKPPPRKAQQSSTLVVNDTPAFIKREQLVYQERQRVKQADEEVPWQPKTVGQTRSFPAKTTVLSTPKLPVQPHPPPTDAPHPALPAESFDDAMADIFEAVHPESPQRAAPSASLPFSDASAEAPSDHDTTASPLPSLPRIQIGAATNTDELFEIVRQRIHQLSQLLVPIAARVPVDTHSDFGDDADDDMDLALPTSEERTALGLVFAALARHGAAISRLKFQHGLAAVLAIDVSWHQFDLLFRRLDGDGDSELDWREFHDVFTRRHISFDRDDLLILQEALSTTVLAKLETQQWTLSELFRAFDRDGGGAVSIAEFATLVRFLFASASLVAQHQRETSHRINKRHVYLLMSCLDASADRRITVHEFLRFFFIVWSARLQQVQDQLMDDGEGQAELLAAKRTLRRVLRTNFSRPFRDAMRCLDVSVPGPFTGLLSRLELLHVGDQGQPSSNQQQDTAMIEQARGMQVWQVLRGQTSSSHRTPGSYAHLETNAKAQRLEASRRRVQKGKNEVQRTRLTRQRDPHRDDAVLRTPASHVALDHAAALKFDFRPPK